MTQADCASRGQDEGCDWFEAVPARMAMATNIAPSQSGGHREHFEKLWPKQRDHPTPDRRDEDVETSAASASPRSMLHGTICSTGEAVTDSAILEEVLNIAS